MPDFVITVDDILKGANNYDALAHTAHRAAQTVGLGDAVTVCFESRHSALGFLQSLVVLEGLSCPVSLAAECEEAESLYVLPQGHLRVTLSLLPKAKMTPAALCRSLKGPIESLHLDVAGHLCPITLDGPLSPRVVACVSLPPAAQHALTQPGAKVVVTWQGQAPDRAVVPEHVWRLWGKAWASQP